MSYCRATRWGSTGRGARGVVAVGGLGLVHGPTRRGGRGEPRRVRPLQGAGPPGRERSAQSRPGCSARGIDMRALRACTRLHGEIRHRGLQGVACLGGRHARCSVVQAGTRRGAAGLLAGRGGLPGRLMLRPSGAAPLRREWRVAQGSGPSLGRSRGPGSALGQSEGARPRTTMWGAASPLMESLE